MEDNFSMDWVGVGMVQAVMRVMGSDGEWRGEMGSSRWSFALLPAAHLLLCVPLPKGLGTGTQLGTPSVNPGSLCVRLENSILKMGPPNQEEFPAHCIKKWDRTFNEWLTWNVIICEDLTNAILSSRNEHLLSCLFKSVDSGPPSALGPATLCLPDHTLCQLLWF